MKRLFVVFGLVALPLVVRAELSIPVPEGWLDLSPGASEENFRNVPTELIQMSRGGQYTALGYDVIHTESGFTPNLNAVRVDQRLRVREGDVEEAAAKIVGQMVQRLPGLRLVDRGLVEVDGVSALRLVYDSEQAGRELRHMAVVVPGNPSAVVTYTALRGQFDALRHSFEAHAASIRGAEERGALGFINWGSVMRAGIVGGVLGAIGGLALKLFRRKRD